METTPNNKLIAEFMGATQNKDMEYEMYGIIQTIKDEPTSKHFFFENEMLFDTDWNWLMAVVEKIESIVWEELNDTSFDVTIGATSYCVIQDNNGGIIEIIGQGTTKIESVYKAVIEFIKWYNLNN